MYSKDAIFPFLGQFKDLLNQYIIEASSGQYDYVKALAEFSSRDESALNFKKGDIIAVVPKHDAYTEKVPIHFIIHHPIHLSYISLYILSYISLNIHQSIHFIIHQS